MISIGLLSDVHYAAGKANGSRYCHLSDAKLKACLDFFSREGIDHVICLGDMIDKGDHPDDDLQNLNTIAGILQRYKGSVHTAIGNHDLDSMTKDQFLERLAIRSKMPYYAFMICEDQFLVLDPNYKTTGEAYTPGQFEWDDAYLPPDQINWLSSRLSLNHYRRTFILSHQNLDQRFCNGQADPHIISNASEIRRLMESKKKKITVLQGHYHHGYFQQMKGISYFTLKAMCEGSCIQNNSFAVLDLYDDGRVVARGYGDQQTVEIESCPSSVLN